MTCLAQWIAAVTIAHSCAAYVASSVSVDDVRPLLRNALPHSGSSRLPAGVRPVIYFDAPTSMRQQSWRR